MINSIQSHSLIPNFETQLSEQAHSQTSWKTHLFVVLGYTLVSIGIGLAFATFYMSTMIHPLLALAAPVPPIVGGSLLISRGQAIFLPKLFQKGETPFAGIENRGGNDCWINSALQVLFHSPAFVKRIESAKGGFRLFEHPLKPLFDAYDSYQKGEPVNSQDLRRQWLIKQNVCQDMDGQEESLKLLEYVFEKLGYQFPTLFEKRIDMQDGKVTYTSESKTSDRNPVRFFDLETFIDSEKPMLEKALKRYFKDIVHDGNTRRTTMRFMEHPPEDFGVALSPPFYIDGAKHIIRVETPMTLTLPSQYIGEETSYTCDAFTYHQGSNGFYGHWFSCIKKEEKWWLASDSSVTEISEREAQEKMRTAPFLHYTKVY